MGRPFQVFVDLTFQGRLRNQSELVRAEIFAFTELIEQFGTAAMNVPGYSMLASCGAWPRRQARREVWLKVRGVWTSLWIERRQKGVFVLHDH